MSLYVSTNVSSLNSQRKLANATHSLNISYQRLSSGLRINSARDDAAGLQISDRLTAQINGLNQGNRNVNDGIALAQTVEGALDETTNMLQRIRVLSVQAANGTNSSDDRLAIQEEVTQLCTEINRIAQKTTFAGAQVLDGAPKVDATQPNLINPSRTTSSGKVLFQVGANDNDTMDLNLSVGFKLSKMDQTQAGNKRGVTPIPASNLPKSKFDPDAEWDKVVKSADNRGLVMTVATWNSNKANSRPATYGPVRYSVSSAVMAQRTLANIDSILTYVDRKRSEVGALQNRMEATLRNQSNIAENESDARSRIRDTDFASETAHVTQNNIIQSASQSILAQANQRPQIALQLLGQ